VGKIENRASPAKAGARQELCNIINMKSQPVYNLLIYKQTGQDCGGGETWHIY
jgi:hypothetical protein